VTAPPPKTLVGNREGYRETFKVEEVNGLPTWHWGSEKCVHRGALNVHFNDQRRLSGSGQAIEGDRGKYENYRVKDIPRATGPEGHLKRYTMNLPATEIKGCLLGQARYRVFRGMRRNHKVGQSMQGRIRRGG